MLISMLAISWLGIPFVRVSDRESTLPSNLTTALTSVSTPDLNFAPALFLARSLALALDEEDCGALQ